MEPKKYQYIDSLRGLAILLVIFVHSSMMTNFILYVVGISQALEPLQKFIFNGQYGVQLFFIASSFTLMLSYHNRINEPNRTRNFFIRRFFRIAPMYYCAIAIAVAKTIYEAGYLDIPWGGMLSSMFFINSLFPKYSNNFVPGGWSVSIEFIFYFLMPYLCTKITNLNKALLFVILSLLFSTITCHFLRLWYNDDFVYYSIFSQLPIFALGIFAYYLVSDNNKEIKKSTWLLLCGTIFIFCYVTIPYHFLYSMIFVLLLIILAKTPCKLFSNKILAAIGKVSFSMYIVHFILIYAVYFFKPNINIDSIPGNFIYFIFSYLALTGVTYGLSRLTYKFIEIPGQNLGRKLIKKLDQQK